MKIYTPYYPPPTQRRYFFHVIIFTQGVTPTGAMRRSRSASTELSEAALGGIKAREGSKSTGNLNHYGKNHYHDPDETSSLRSYHSTPGESLTSGGLPPQRNRRVSESDARAEPQGPTSYRDVMLEREDNESFGFVIFSSVHKSGSTIGE